MNDVAIGEIHKMVLALIVEQVDCKQSNCKTGAPVHHASIQSANQRMVNKTSSEEGRGLEVNELAFQQKIKFAFNRMTDPTNNEQLCGESSRGKGLQTVSRHG